MQLDLFVKKNKNLQTGCFSFEPRTGAVNKDTENSFLATVCFFVFSFLFL